MAEKFSLIMIVTQWVTQWVTKF